MEAIAPILFASSVVQGYGRLDEIACLYGMMWNTPKLMKGLLARLKEAASETGTNFLTLKFSDSLTILQGIITLDENETNKLE